MDVWYKERASISAGAEERSAARHFDCVVIKMTYAYLSPTGACNLHTYQYEGGDYSLLYQHVLSPLASRLSLLLPESISANLITYLGHLSLTCGYVLCWVHCGLSLNCRPPAWILWLTLALYFAWIVLDNIDGKQARRLGISSPLGLLFDHQVDALNVFTTATFFGIVSGYGDSPYTIGSWFVAVIPFYLFTWEELNIGKLEFPMLSGTSEGTVMLGGIMALMIWNTPAELSTVLVFGLPLPIFIFWLAVALGLLNAVYNLQRVATLCKDSKTACVSILPFIYFAFTVFTAIWVSPAKIGGTAAREFLVFVGFAFSREMCYMQLAHVTSTKYVALNLPNFALLTAFIVNSWAHRYSYGLMDEYSLLVILAVASTWSYCYLAYTLATEVATELGIPIFAVPKRKHY